ncbi:MAG: CorA family divalent cation transporter [Pyrobaculum sp.]
MAYIFEEGGKVVVQIPHVALEGGEVVERYIEVVADRGGKALGGPYGSIQEAFLKALEDLSKTLTHAESFLDRVEYSLEAEERIEPREIYTASYMAHQLYYTASQLRQTAGELLKRGFITYRQYVYAKSAARKALALRRYARDLRLLYASVVQLSLDASMRRLTWLGTVAIPAILISSLYGMNLSWLPLADRPEAVFLLIAMATAGFAYFLRFKLKT